MHRGLARRAFALMAAAPIEGCLAEFGVYQGDGLCALAELWRARWPGPPPLYGFDSFEGMPPTAVPLAASCAQEWAPGTFADTSVEAVERRLRAAGVAATLVKGVFADVPPLDRLGIDAVRFVHLDADIYEGYRDALRLLTPHVRIGTVLLFDEVVAPTDHRYQSVRAHGRRAVDEWERATGVNLHLIRVEWTAGLYVIVDEDYLRRYASLIVRIRRDSGRDLLAAALGHKQMAWVRRARTALRRRGA